MSASVRPTFNSQSEEPETRAEPSQPRPDSADHEPAATAVYLLSDGRIDTLGLFMAAGIPLLWNSYMFYLATKKNGGLGKMLEDTADPVAAMNSIKDSISIIKETINAARSA